MSDDERLAALRRDVAETDPRGECCRRLWAAMMARAVEDSLDPERLALSDFRVICNMLDMDPAWAAGRIAGANGLRFRIGTPAA